MYKYTKNIKNNINCWKISQKKKILAYMQKKYNKIVIYYDNIPLKSLYFDKLRDYDCAQVW